MSPDVSPDAYMPNNAMFMLLTNETATFAPHRAHHYKNFRQKNCLILCFAKMSKKFQDIIQDENNDKRRHVKKKNTQIRYILTSNQLQAYLTQISEHTEYWAF